MKKLISVFLLLALLCALSGCGASKSSAPAASAPAASAADLTPKASVAPKPTEAPKNAGTPAPEAAEAPDAPPEEDVAEYIDPYAFVGTWIHDRATLSIAPLGAAPEEERFKCLIQWGNSAAETVLWEYDCYCDGERLVSFETGVKRSMVYDESGDFRIGEVFFTDGAAAFELKEQNLLVWTDFKESPDGGVYEFERAEYVGTDPTEEDFAEDFFRPVAGLPEGSAGASLQKAVAALGMIRFAGEHRLWCLPEPFLTETMQAGWDSLSADEKTAFAERFDAVAALIDETCADPDANLGRFQDAGVGTAMKFFALVDPISMLGWKALRDAAVEVAGRTP